MPEHDDHDLRLRLCRLCGSKTTRATFPGAHPSSLDRAALTSLHPASHFVSDKTDGARRLLFLTTAPDGSPQTVMLDRMMAITPIPDLIGARSLHQGTILDGELIGDSLFLVFDAIAFCGFKIFTMRFTERLAFLSGRADVTHALASSPSLDIRIKPFFPLTDLLLFYHHCRSAPYTTDGVILIDDLQPYHPGRHHGMLKWKPLAKCTVDFCLAGDCGTLSNCKVRAPIAHRPAHARDGEIWECRFDGSAWRPILHRTDKGHPNDRISYEKTVQNIAEDVSLDEVFRPGNPDFSLQQLDDCVAALHPLLTRPHIELEFRLGTSTTPSALPRSHWEDIRHTLEASALPRTSRTTVDHFHTGDVRKRVCLDTGGVETVRKSRLLHRDLRIGDHSIRVAVSEELPVTLPSTAPSTGAADRERRKHTTRYYHKNWAFDLATCAPTPTTKETFTVELEALDLERCNETAVYLVSSGLLKCRDLVRMVADLSK